MENNSSSYQTDDLFYDIIGHFKPEPSEEEIRRARAHVRQKILDRIYFLNGISDGEEVIFQRAYFDEYEYQIEMYTSQRYPYAFSYVLKSGNDMISAGVVPFKAGSFTEALDKFNEACELLLYFERVRRRKGSSSKLIKFEDHIGDPVYARVKLVDGKTQILRIKVSNIQKLLIEQFNLHSSNLEFLEYDYDPSVVTDDYSEFGNEKHLLATYDSNLIEIFDNTKKVFSYQKATPEDFIETCQIVKYMNESYSPATDVDEFWPGQDGGDEPENGAV